jgi:hypothetical protein
MEMVDFSFGKDDNNRDERSQARGLVMVFSDHLIPGAVAKLIICV